MLSDMGRNSLQVTTSSTSRVRDLRGGLVFTTDLDPLLPPTLSVEPLHTLPVRARQDVPFKDLVALKSEVKGVRHAL